MNYSYDFKEYRGVKIEFSLLLSARNWKYMFNLCFFLCIVYKLQSIMFVHECCGKKIGFFTVISCTNNIENSLLPIIVKIQSFYHNVHVQTQ